MKLPANQLNLNASAKTARLQNYDGGARQFLTQLAVDLIKADGTVKSGYLKLKVRGDEARLDSNHFGSGASVATDLVKKLVKDAYGEAASTALDQYLEGKGKAKVGTVSFVKLIKAMEEGAEPLPSNPQLQTKLSKARGLDAGSINTGSLKSLKGMEWQAIQNSRNGNGKPEELLLSGSQGIESGERDVQNVLQELVGYQSIEALQIAEDLSASEALTRPRQNDPVAARQARAQQFSNMNSAAAKNPSLPLPGQINHITDYKLLKEKPDLSDSVTLLELGALPVDLRGMNLKNAQLLIRPAFGDHVKGNYLKHWGVDLSGADLVNTHIELDLSTGLQEKIDSGEVETFNFTHSLLQNNLETAPSGPGGGGVVGMIASIPPGFPALRIALTEQLLDFLNRHPSQAAASNVAGWPAKALCVVSLVDQFPELRNNPRVAEAAKLFASGISMKWSLSGFLGEIKDPTRPSPLLVLFGLDLCLAGTPEAQKEFFMTNSQRINVLLDYAERVDDSHPEANEIKRLASKLEEAYLSTEPFASLSKPFTDYDEKVRVLLSHDQKLNQSSALVIPVDQFQNMLLNPGEVRWDLLSASRFDPNNPRPPEFIKAESLRTDLPLLAAKFPIVKDAYESPSTNAASRAISELFHASPEVQKMMTAFLDRGVRATALGAEEVSAVFSRALQSIYQDFQPIYDLEKWPEARLKPDHLEQLLALAKAEGLGDNKTAFARYLFVMSAALLKMSSYKGYGSEDVSVTSLRFYAHSLIGEAERLAPSLNFEWNDYDGLKRFEKDIRSTACANDLSSDMINGAKANMPHSGYRVLPNHLSPWNRKPSAPDENANLPAEVVY
jgi:hypothetical protein